MARIAEHLILGLAILAVAVGSAAMAAGDNAAALGVSAARYGLTESYVSVDAIPDFPRKSETDTFRVAQIDGTTPANILWPGEKVGLTLQFVNKTDRPLKMVGKVHVIGIALASSPEDMFKVAIKRLSEEGVEPIAVELPSKGYQNVTIAPTIPERFGGYALLVEMDGQEPLFVAGVVRTFKNPSLGYEYRLCMDIQNARALVRLGAAPNRIGFPCIPADHPEFEERLAKLAQKLRELKTAGLPVTVEFGHETPWNDSIQPLGHARHELDANGRMKNTYGVDIAPSPAIDPGLKKAIKRLAMEYGWPKGPINAMKLWNEPWEGGSIAGWAADCIRYRELYTVMCEAVEEARKEGNVQILLGGCDSSSNTFDKLFPDGDDKFLKWLDFSSIHYQGLAPASTVKAWVDRKHPNGRVRVWDTESWCANSDDRVASTIASMYAAGHDRVLAIHSQRIVSPECEIDVMTDKGMEKREVTQAWPVGAAIGAVQHFIGNREFDRIVLESLPWVYAFKGQNAAGGAANVEDGTLVIVGDITPVFQDNIPLFRNVRCLDEVSAKRELHAKLAVMDAHSPERQDVERAFRKRLPLTNVTMTIADPEGRFGLYDYYGNSIPAKSGRLVIPLDDHGYYLCGDGKAGSFLALIDAVKQAEIKGLQPAQVVCTDMLAPISQRPTMQVELTSMLNRPVTGKLDLKVGKLKIEYPAQITLAPRERKVIEVKVMGGEADASNDYPLSLSFDAGADGLALHTETMHCNVIARKTINVDGTLKDWNGVLPQTIVGDGSVNRTQAEVAWKPYEAFDANARKGLATTWMAYDGAFFYFAAKVADDTPDGGTLRFKTMDHDAFFYPDKVTILEKGEDGKERAVEHKWPEGVRRYSYGYPFILPCGNAPALDNVQIAFNAVPEADKPWYPFPPGTMQGFTSDWCTDYEYDLNQVAAKYGGGTELWRQRHPLMPNKHFFPRQPKSPMDGPVAAGKLVIRHDGNTRITECAIPWAEIPHVKAALDAGKTIGFTVRVNDNSGVGCMELARHRSVSRQNNNAFKPDWSEHWANEVRFSFER